MEDLAPTFEHTSAMVDSQLLDTDLVGDLDLRDLMLEVRKLVADELKHMVLSESADENEEMLRGLMANAANKAFFAGLALGQERVTDAGMVVEVPQEMLDSMGTNAIRHGVISLNITLTAPLEEAEGPHLVDDEQD